MAKYFKIAALLSIIVCFANAVYAQSNTEMSSNTTTAANSVQMKENNDAVNSMPSQDSKSVTLVVYGTADNENEAIKVALRSAIEQAYGTFVSANTQIVNDELTKDEIVSVTSGNIENYSLISSDKDSDGKTSVSVKATVSIGKLLQFAQSKGATTELAGAAFAMNMKMKKLNKKNESEAIIQMYNKLLKICDLNLFDFTITTSDPHLVNGFTDFYSIPVTIGITPNKNYDNLRDEFFHTIRALSLTETEAEEYKKANISTFRSEGFIFRNELFGYNMKGVSILDVLFDKFVLSSCSFSIKDNLGNSSVPVKQTYVENKSRYSIIPCHYPIIGYNDTVYGITTSSSNNPNKFFLGKKCNMALEKDDWGDFRYWASCYRCSKFHKAFGSDFNIFNMGVSYDFEIRLYYKEEELSRLNSITIEPIKPSEVKCSTIRLE